MKFGIVVFPGSNCDHDVYDVVKRILGQEACFLWHKNHTLEDSDVVVLPGGFSYGDYLRTGAIARFSPIMREVIDFARKGRPVMGICNGFQVLTETGLLDGALMRNRDLSFICKDVYLRVEQNDTAFTSCYKQGQVIRIPVAHHDGNYFANDDIIKKLEDNNQILFRYCDEQGNINELSNPNGSRSNIAGICNKSRNVVGMMPHPERVISELIGGIDGRGLFESLVA